MNHHQSHQRHAKEIARLQKEVFQAKDEADFALKRLNHETEQKKRLQEILHHIGDLAHTRSTGPAVPDTLWEIRQLAYDTLKEYC